MYPLLWASSVEEKQILFSGFIFWANWQVGRWYLFEFLLATKAHFWLSAVAIFSAEAGATVFEEEFFVSITAGAGHSFLGTASTAETLLMTTGSCLSFCPFRNPASNDTAAMRIMPIAYMIFCSYLSQNWAIRDSLKRDKIDILSRINYYSIVNLILLLWHIVRQAGVHNLAEIRNPKGLASRNTAVRKCNLEI